MRIVIDARPAIDPHRTGVGTYAEALVRHLPPAMAEDRFAAWYLDVRGLGRRPHRFAGWAPNLVERASRIPSRLFGPVSSRTGLPRVEWLAGASELFIATNYLPPPSRSQGVVMVVHDLAFETMPETAPHHDARWRRSFARWLGRATAVIVPSEATGQELFAHHDVDRAKVTVVAHGTDVEAFTPVTPLQVEAVRSRFDIPGPYIVFLGGLEPRKNLERLIEAFGMLEGTDVALVIAGGAVRWAPSYAERVDEAIAALAPGARERVVRVGYVDDVDRRALLSGAEILAYPSRAEGFGFPVLEAIAANVPVVTSTTSSLPEVAGDAAVLVDPEDPAAIAGGLQELLGDDDLRNVLRAAGTARVASFTWQRAARETAAVLRRAAQHGR
ncbi:MAG: glycosyltransferase family 1 protein [Actinomycetota bacterium]